MTAMTAITAITADANYLLEGQPEWGAGGATIDRMGG